MSETSKGRFSPREWWLFILLISIVQGWIWYTAFVNARNASALNYVSFAGTLISIILAVLAIGYTYGESVKQKNSSDTVVNQIGELNEVIKNIRIEASALSSISEISQRLQNLSSSFNDGMQNISEMKEGVFELKSVVTSAAVKYSPDSKETSSKHIRFSKTDFAQFFPQSQNAMVDIALLLILLYKDQNGVKDRLLPNISNYLKKLLEVYTDLESRKKLNIMFWGGGIHTTFEILDNMRLIQNNNEKFVVDPEFENYIEENILSSDKKYAGKSSQDFKNLVIADIKQQEK